MFLCAIPHSFALGPLPWLMMSEIFPTRIRARAVAITTTFIWFVGFVASALFPAAGRVVRDDDRHDRRRLLALRPASAFWRSVFGLTLLPETEGRTLEEIADSWRR